MLSPTLKFLAWIEGFEAFEYLEMVVVIEDGCTDVMGAGSREDVLRGECGAGSIKRLGAGSGLFPEIIGGWDVNKVIKKRRTCGGGVLPVARRRFYRWLRW